MKFLILVEIVEVILNQEFNSVFFTPDPLAIGLKCTHIVDSKDFEVNRIFEFSAESIFVKSTKCKMLEVLEFEGTDGIFRKYNLPNFVKYGNSK